MARVAVLGEQVAVQGYALAGAVVLAVDDDDAARAAWDALPADVAVVILTRAAARALGPERVAGPHPMTAVMAT
jgi:vacuolar-type H+-ATPase subunit F/Vma7